ncbi:MAG: energy transducer TonB [Acidobacteriota bacterium]
MDCSNPMRAIAIATVILVAFSPAGFADEGTERTATLIAEAHELVAAGETSQAITTLETVDRMTKGQSIDALLLLAAVHNDADEAKKAIHVAKKVLKLDPSTTQAAEANFQIGLGWLDRATPDDPKGSWNRSRLHRALQALRQAVVLGGPRGPEATAHLGYVLVLQAVHLGASEKTLIGGMALARDGFVEGSPADGMEIARYVLCGSSTCEPLFPEQDNDRFEAAVDEKPVHPQLHDSAGGVMVKPVKLSAPIERSRELAEALGVEGRIIIQAIVDQRGHVANLRVLKGLPFGVETLAAEEVRQWRFEPATVDGRPVPSYYNLLLNY